MDNHIHCNQLFKGTFISWIVRDNCFFKIKFIFQKVYVSIESKAESPRKTEG